MKHAAAILLGAALGAAALGAAALGAPAAQAAQMRSGETVLIPAGTTIDDDLYVAGGTVTVAGNVTGDLVAAGGTVIVRGRVGGDVILAGGQVRVEGATGQSARVAGGEVRLEGAVGKDLLATGGNLRTGPSLAVAGQSFVSGGELRLAGDLGRSLRAGAGALALVGQVRGPAALVAPKLQVERSARVQGDLTLTTDAPDPIAQGASYGGQVVRNPMPEQHRNGMAGRILLFLMALVTGLALLRWLPGLAERSDEAARHRPGWRFLVGFLVLVGVPLGAVLLMVTVVGLPLGFLALLGYLAALYLAQLVVGWTVGRTLVGKRPGALERWWPRAGALALGLLLLHVAQALPILGPLFSFAILLWGLGAIARLVVVAFRNRPRAPAPSPI